MITSFFGIFTLIRIIDSLFGLSIKLQWQRHIFFENLIERKYWCFSTKEPNNYLINIFMTILILSYFGRIVR